MVTSIWTGRGTDRRGPIGSMPPHDQHVCIRGRSHEGESHWESLQFKRPVLPERYVQALRFFLNTMCPIKPLTAFLLEKTLSHILYVALML